jgi:LacI family transcriptional regulator
MIPHGLQGLIAGYGVKSIPPPAAGRCQGALSRSLLSGLSLLEDAIDYLQTMTSPDVESIPVPARLRDVAAVAGVSMSTASRVLSGAPGVSPRSAAAVVAASKRLGYRPNLIARGLRARTTGLVGIIIPGIGNPFFAELVEALESVLYDASLDMILSDSRGTSTDEARRLQTLLDRQVDGLIMIPAGHHSSAPAMQWAHRAVPIVQIDRQVDGFPADYVGVDNALGIRLTLEHLAGQGASTLAFVSDDTASSTGRSRFDAFRLTVPRVPGLEMSETLLGSFSIGFGREAAKQLMRHSPLPDAVVCGSDLVALGVVREFRQSGIAIPGRVKVTGFDGILFGELCDPPLTTVLQPILPIAAEAVRILQSRMRGDQGAARRSEIAPSLIVRSSSLAAQA